MRKQAVRRLLQVSIVCFGIMGSTASAAASADSLYSYNLRSAQATITNQATSNQGASLNLRGSWSSNAEGVLFNGNQSGSQSVGYAQPASATINVAAEQAMGLGVAFTYQHVCASDSQNITQVGFFAANESQVKLQLSKCVGGKVFPECRFAGARTPKGTAPIRGSYALQNGVSYRFSCSKGPDNGSRASVTMLLQRIDGGYPNTVYSNTFSIPATGAIKSSKYLSVANKYPLPSPSNNTDQFKGRIAHVAYCQSNTLSAALECLTAELN